MPRYVSLRMFFVIIIIGLGLVWVIRPSAQDQQTPRGRDIEQVGPTVFRVVPSNTPYQRWLAGAKQRHVPVFEGLMIQDARTQPLRPWADMGVDGLYVRMADYQIIDGWVLEIPPKGSSKPLRHMFEVGMFFFGGPGRVTVQQEGRRPQEVPFKYRTLFCVPLNARYQIFNDGNEPVRLMAVTSFPYVMNSMNSEKFVFENPFEFRDRYDADEDFLRKSEKTAVRETVTNYVEDALGFELEAWDERGKGTTNMNWEMGGNSMLSLHVSEMPGAVYKRAHRHTSDAFILLLSGKGYSLTWPEGMYDKRVRVDWTEGTIFVPPTYWYHQHLNPGTDSARYLAINAPTLVTNLGLRFEDQLEPDLPQIAQEFEAEVARYHGQASGQ